MWPKRGGWVVGEIKERALVFRTNGFVRNVRKKYTVELVKSALDNNTLWVACLFLIFLVILKGISVKENRRWEVKDKTVAINMGFLPTFTPPKLSSLFFVPNTFLNTLLCHCWNPTAIMVLPMPLYPGQGCFPFTLFCVATTKQLSFCLNGFVFFVCFEEFIWWTVWRWFCVLKKKLEVLGMDNGICVPKQYHNLSYP